jgi:3-oxoacyl-[acyl-carrier-protein] synthase III
VIFLYKATFSEMFQITGYQPPTPEELEEIQKMLIIAEKEWNEQVERMERKIAARQKQLPRNEFID